jgi:catechol 2,3-dioxygenase-like lactoylglutathione lyase family enzyme
MIEGLSHITLMVSDLKKTERIVVEVLGGKRLYASGERTFSISEEIFFDVRGVWLVLMKGKPLAEKSYNHIAFKIDEAGLEKAEAAIRELGLEVRPPRSRATEEAKSIYFYDYDNHLFELHTGTLADRLRYYEKETAG